MPKFIVLESEGTEVLEARNPMDAAKKYHQALQNQDREEEYNYLVVPHSAAVYIDAVPNTDHIFLVVPKS